MLRKTTIALAVLLLSKLGLAAASDPCKATSSTSDVRFELALKDGRATFQEGEIIPLALSFSSAVKDRYLAEDRNYDRSGRLEIELYCVEPQAPDPLEDYFRQGAFGGGIGGIHKLDTPLIAEAELNEWRKLAPGHYRIYAISHRVSRMPDPAEQTPYGRVSEVVRSNTVDLDVIAPSPKWQSERISEAVHALAGAPSPDVARHAARILRFLNTQVSTRQLAGLFLGLNERQPVGWDLMFGLYGSPFRKLAIDSMHNEIGAPAHAITAEFLRTLVDLQIAADPAWDPPPAALANPGGTQEFWERRRAHTLALTKAETEKVVAALDAKAGSVRAETLNGVLMGGGLDESLAQTIHPVLIDAWPNLSEATERDLIQYRWPLIKGEDMLPILRRIVALPPPRGGTPAAEMRDAALKHIAELDPEAGRALILRDAMGGTASPSLSTIGLLPADDIAAVVKASVQRIGTAGMRDLDYELLDRYADGSALSVVRKLVENPAMWGSCGSPQVYRYLLRVDPAYGAKLVTAALNSRKENACYKHLLQSLGDELPNVQDAAVKALDDPDQDLVFDALIALGRWGTAEAEAALWARLKRLRQEWAGREDQLRSTPDFKSEGSRAAALEGSLADAIAHGVGWLCPPEKLALLGDLVSTKAAKQQIEGWNKAGDWRDGRAVINAIWVSEDSPTFSVLQYGSLNEKQLATKLAQFTSGTQLLWQFWKPGEISPAVTMEVQEATFERIRSIAEKHNVTLGKLNHP